MRVLVVSHPAVLPSNRSVYRALQELGDEVHLVTPHAWRHEYDAQLVRPSPDPAFASMRTLHVIRPGSIIGHLYAARCSRVLQAVQPDVLYVEEEPYGLATAQWVLAARRRGVATCFYTAQNITKRYPLVVRRLEKLVHSAADAVAISEDARRALRARGFRRAAHVVPLSIDTSMFSPVPNRSRARQTPTVGFVGRLVPEKGLGVLLEAKDLCPVPFRLLVVGDGPLRESLHGRHGVEVSGPQTVEAMPSQYARMDVLVVPSLTTRSWREQFGRAVLEAAASGVAVLSSDSGELPTLLARLGGPRPVPEGDAAALAASLGALLADDEQRQRYALQMRSAVDQFSVQAIARTLRAALASASS